MNYTIETRSPNRPLRTAWDRDAVGARESNVFATRLEAEAAIESLRSLGDDWAAAEYRVVEVA